MNETQAPVIVCWRNVKSTRRWLFLPNHGLVLATIVCVSAEGDKFLVQYEDELAAVDNPDA